MKNRFDLLIFDWDGTLVDSIDWIVHCIQFAAKENNCLSPSVDATKDIIGLSIQESIKRLFPETDAFTQEKIVQCYGDTFASKQPTAQDLFAGVLEMLDYFRQENYQLAIATGKTRCALDKVLASTGVAEYFCITRCADETASKPNPLMLEEIMHYTQTPPSRALMIGDSAHDLQMAKNAHISAIGVSCGAHSAEILQAYQPLYCLKHPFELLTIMTG